MRLTYSNADGVVWFKSQSKNDIWLEPCEMTAHDNRIAIAKLAAYEDAEEQGRLVILPQKTVYTIGWGEGKNCDHICPAAIDGVGLCSLCDNGELVVYEEECRQEHLPHIGKTVFLAREEAEAALKGGQDDGSELEPPEVEHD